MTLAMRQCVVLIPVWVKADCDTQAMQRTWSALHNGGVTDPKMVALWPD